MYPGTMSVREFASGILPSGTPVVTPLAGGPLPATLTLKSAAGGRAIEISTDGGVEYFVPVIDTTSATMLIVAILAPITHARFTGTTNDSWSVR